MKSMRLFLTLPLALLASFSWAAESDNSIGLSYSLTAQPYQGADSSGSLAPSINVDWGRFYWHGDDGGYRLHDSQNSGLTLYGKWRPFTYQDSDSPQLTGMGDRQTGIDFGLMAHYLNPDIGLFRLAWVKDWLGIHNGEELRVEYGIGTQNRQYSLLLLLGLYQRDQNYHHYYYGVDPDQARAGRAAYQAQTASSYDLAFYAKYNLNRDWQLSSKLLYDRLPTTVQNSPIVDSNQIISGSIGFTYRF